MIETELKSKAPDLWCEKLLTKKEIGNRGSANPLGVARRVDDEMGARPARTRRGGRARRNCVQ